MDWNTSLAFCYDTAGTEPEIANTIRRGGKNGEKASYAADTTCHMFSITHCIQISPGPVLRGRQDAIGVLNIRAACTDVQM